MPEVNYIFVAFLVVISLFTLFLMATFLLSYNKYFKKRAVGKLCPYHVVKTLKVKEMAIVDSENCQRCKRQKLW